MKSNNTSWLSSAVVYQVNLRSIAAREPRNAIEARTERILEQSPLAYLTQNLKRLRRLGFNVLYLLPPYSIGFHARKGIGSPYASRNFKEVESEYGTPAELAALVRQAHALKLKVIFDITPNHTARDHVWMAQHPEFYVKAPDGSAFFDWDWSDTAKLDYTNPGTRAAMIDVYDHWLSMLGKTPDGHPDGIDGFRLDMAHLINDTSFWNEALPILRARHPNRQLLFMAECYGFNNNLDLFARGIDAAYDDDFYKLAQYAYAVDPAGNSVLRLSADAQHNHDFRSILDAWQDGGIAAAAARILMQYEEAAPRFDGPRFAARYTDNHDEGRGLFRFGPGAFAAMNALSFLSSRCFPFLFTGQEFGAVNRPPIHERCSVCDKGPRVVAADGREFQKPGVEFEGNLFSRTFEERHRWYDFHKELIDLRLKNPPLVDGACSILDVGEDASTLERTVVAFDRTLGKKLLRCAVNLGDQPRKLDRAPHLLSGQTLYGHLDADGCLPPFSALVVKIS
jgi:glycosidase